MVCDRDNLDGLLVHAEDDAERVLLNDQATGPNLEWPPRLGTICQESHELFNRGKEARGRSLTVIKVPLVGFIQLLRCLADELNAHVVRWLSREARPGAPPRGQPRPRPRREP